MSSISLIRATREILWKYSCRIISAEVALDQIDRAVREYNGESEQLIIEFAKSETGRAA